MSFSEHSVLRNSNWPGRIFLTVVLVFVLAMIVLPSYRGPAYWQRISKEIEMRFIRSLSNEYARVQLGQSLLPDYTNRGLAGTNFLRVSIIGAVERPGRYNIAHGDTVYPAVEVALVRWLKFNRHSLRLFIMRKMDDDPILMELTYQELDSFHPLDNDIVGVTFRGLGNEGVLLQESFEKGNRTPVSTSKN